VAIINSVEVIYRGMLAGSPVDVKETMARFTTDVIASCAFGINGNSLKDPDAEFRKYLKKIFEFTFQRGLAALMSFFAPYLNTVFKLKIWDDLTTNYLRKTVWSTVEYR
jgi:cytochrome P450 family 6